jgi:pullulanase/glycogen debranching enzyme
VPVRRRRQETRDRPARARGAGLARLPAADRARAALRLPRARPVRPGRGLRCNPAKLLLDPYAKAIDGQIDWNEALYSYRFADHGAFNDLDSAPYTQRSVVTNPFFDWTNDRRCGSRTTRP